MVNALSHQGFLNGPTCFALPNTQHCCDVLVQYNIWSIKVISAIRLQFRSFGSIAFGVSQLSILKGCRPSTDVRNFVIDVNIVWFVQTALVDGLVASSACSLLFMIKTCLPFRREFPFRVSWLAGLFDYASYDSFQFALAPNEFVSSRLIVNAGQSSSFHALI